MKALGDREAGAQLRFIQVSGKLLDSFPDGGVGFGDPAAGLTYGREQCVAGGAPTAFRSLGICRWL